MNETIKQLQSFMKTSPAGVSYSGPVDGESNPQLQAATNNLQNVIRKSLSNSSNSDIASKAKSYTIMSGNSVVRTLADIKSLLSEIGKKEPAPKKEEGNKNIKAVQQIFNSNPFGIKYSGPINGVITPELIQQSRLLETTINGLTGANISGKITDGSTITTTASDLQKTFNLIVDYQKFVKKTK